MAADKFRGRRLCVLSRRASLCVVGASGSPQGGIRLRESTSNLALEACRQNIVDGLAFFQKLLEFDQFGDSIYEQLNEFPLKSQNIFLEDQNHMSLNIDNYNILVLHFLEQKK